MIAIINRWNDINTLMNNWKEKHIKKGYERFVADGIVNLKKWSSQNTPKVCFFLKEAYTTTDEDQYNLVKDLDNYEPWKMWKKVAIWTAAIHNACKGNIEYNEEILRSKTKELIQSIAVINVKKSNGKSNSNNEDLKKYAIEDSEELKVELEIINPDVIICGYSLGLLKIVLGNDLIIDNTCDNMYGYWGKTVVIDYYHPACRYPNGINYYALMSIYQIALKNKLN